MQQAPRDDGTRPITPLDRKIWAIEEFFSDQATYLNTIAMLLVPFTLGMTFAPRQCYEWLGFGDQYSRLSAFVSAMLFGAIGMDNRAVACSTDETLQRNVVGLSTRMIVQIEWSLSRS
jgi:hypothetical protein